MAEGASGLTNITQLYDRGFADPGSKLQLVFYCEGLFGIDRHQRLVDSSEPGIEVRFLFDVILSDRSTRHGSSLGWMATDGSTYSWVSLKNEKFKLCVPTVGRNLFKLFRAGLNLSHQAIIIEGIDRWVNGEPTNVTFVKRITRIRR